MNFLHLRVSQQEENISRDYGLAMSEMILCCFPKFMNWSKVQRVLSHSLLCSSPAVHPNFIRISFCSVFIETVLERCCSTIWSWSRRNNRKKIILIQYISTAPQSISSKMIINLNQQSVELLQQKLNILIFIKCRICYRAVVLDIISFRLVY